MEDLRAVIPAAALLLFALAAPLAGQAAPPTPPPAGQNAPAAPEASPSPGAPAAPNPSAPAGAPATPAFASIATAVARKGSLEGRILWLDATANLERLSTPEGVARILDKCQRANLNTIVVDVKPLSGHVLYDSKIAPRLREWRGFPYPEGYDLLRTVLEEGHRRGLKVYASVNTFCEAHKLVRSGPLYERPELQAIVYEARRTLTAADGASVVLGLGENRAPADGEIVAWTPAMKEGKRLTPEEAAVVVQGERVTALIDGSLAGQGPIAAPADGYLLIGRGSGARWLLEHLPVESAPAFSVQEALVPILEALSETVGGFVNPANPESRNYMLRIVEEIAERYAVDGIVFDRMRYASLRTDFSSLSREQFEAWLGKKLERFPQDIYAYDPVPGRPIVPGPYYEQWLEWRARNIRTWLEAAREAALRKRPGLAFGVYVGSWYPEYYGVGVNWGAEDFAPGYEWMTPEYPATGYAGRLAWLTTGCYYPVVTREDARQLGLPEEETVEASAELSVRAVNDAAFVYAGLNLLDYKGRPEEFRRALETALRCSQGVMLFDLVYLEEYDWWNLLTEVFQLPRRAPHDVPGLQEAIQQTKRALRSVSGSPAGGAP